MEHFEEYAEAIRQKVCAKCIDRGMYGQCGLTTDQQCAVELHLPEIVRSVLSVKSDSLDRYLESLRTNVCGVCTHQTRDGSCMLRKQLDCGLDRYFPLIIEAIEQTHLALNGPHSTKRGAA